MTFIFYSPPLLPSNTTSELFNLTCFALRLISYHSTFRAFQGIDSCAEAKGSEPVPEHGLPGPSHQDHTTAANW